MIPDGLGKLGELLKKFEGSLSEAGEHTHLFDLNKSAYNPEEAVPVAPGPVLDEYLPSGLGKVLLKKPDDGVDQALGLKKFSPQEMVTIEFDELPTWILGLALKEVRDELNEEGETDLSELVAEIGGRVARKMKNRSLTVEVKQLNLEKLFYVTVTYTLTQEEIEGCLSGK